MHPRLDYSKGISFTLAEDERGYSVVVVMEDRTQKVYRKSDPVFAEMLSTILIAKQLHERGA